MKKGCRLPSLSSLWAPEVMALERGPLLLLTLSLGLASAQKSLEEVPVQPGFDAQKVTVLLGSHTQPWDEDLGASVTWRLCSGVVGRTQRARGQ